MALHLALSDLVGDGRLAAMPLSDSVAAVSVGIVDGEPLLDLAYVEDSRAEVDMNVVMSGSGAADRGAGHRRADTVRQGLARSPARAGGGRDRDARGPAGVGADRGLTSCGWCLRHTTRIRPRELTRLLDGFEIEPYTGSMPPETGSTFRENALIKARHVHRLVGAGVWVVADDSGIVAAALGGAPGVYSARFAGADADDAANLQKLLEELARAPRSPCQLCRRTGGGRP